MNSKYYKEINITRGIALLFVLVGHSFPDEQIGMTEVAAIWIYKIIFSFHMGLFFFLSGFVSGRTLCEKKINLYGEISKKFKRLMIPYFVWSFITLGLKQIFSDFANNQFALSDFWKIALGDNPNGGMWYLWTLFVISILFLLLHKFGFGAFQYLIVGIMLLILSNLFPSTYQTRVLEYSIFYALGIFAWKNYKKVKHFLKGKRGVIVSVISVLVFIGALGKSPYYVTCISASIPILKYSIYTAERGKINNRILNELGTYSYDIYLTSYFVQVSIRVVCYQILNIPYWDIVIIMMIFGTLIPYILCKYIIRKIPILNKILLGNWRSAASTH